MFECYVSWSEYSFIILECKIISVLKSRLDLDFEELSVICERWGVSEVLGRGNDVIKKIN